MSINYWRYVEYTDDGCSRYQCLSCYKQWESRTVPGYFGLDDSYCPVFKFCPFCGVQWAGMRTTGCSKLHEGHKQLGRRRQRIEDAFEARFGYDRWRQPEPPYWLVVEQAEQTERDRDQGKPLAWKPRYKMSGFKASAMKMLKLARQDVVERREEKRRDDDYEFSDWRMHCFTRVVVVRNLAERYPHQDYIYEIYPDRITYSIEQRINDPD